MRTILFVSSPDLSGTGDFVYRVRQPGRAMSALPGVRVISLLSISALRPELIESADVVILDMVGDDDLMPLIAARSGPTIYEMSDNIFDIQPHNPCRAFFHEPHNRAAILSLIGQSDFVQTTSPHLTRIFGRYNPDIRTFPNQLERVPELVPRDGPLTIGWGGSYGHLEDVRTIAPTWSRWLKDHPEARLHMMCHPHIFGLFDDVPSTQKRLFPTGPLEAYESFLDTLDIGIAPIEDTGFNLCRSDVKMLEFQAHGAAVIARAVGPYLDGVRDGDTGLLYREPEELVAHLDRLAANPDELRGFRERGWRYAREERTEEVHAPRRLEAYVSDLPEGGGDDPLGWIEDHPLATRAGERYFEVGLSPAERALFDGLAAEVDGPEAASAHYIRASQLDASLSLTHLYLANTWLARGQGARALQEAERALELGGGYQAETMASRCVALRDGDQAAAAWCRERLALSPGNQRLRMQLALHLGRSGDPQGQRVALEAVLERAPSHALAWRQLAGLCSAAGDHGGTALALGEVLLQDPDDHNARLTLAISLVQGGDAVGALAATGEVLARQPGHPQATALAQKLRSALEGGRRE